MTKKNKLLLCALCLSLSMTTPAHARTFHFIDQILRQMAQRQLGVMFDQAAVLKNQLQQQLRLSDLTQQGFNQLQGQLVGHYGYGQSNFTDALNALPKDMQSALLGQGGNNQYQHIQDYYQERYPSNSGETLEGYYPDPLASNNYQDQSAVSHHALSLSTAVYNNLEQQSEQLKNLIQTIESTPNLKAAIDLNTRMQAQMALQQLQQLKIMSAQLQTQAMNNQQQVNTQTLEQKFLHRSS